MSDRTEDVPDVVLAELRWARVAKGLRYEDIPAHMIRPLRVWRPSPPDMTSGTGSSMAMCADLGGPALDAGPRKRIVFVDEKRMLSLIDSGLTQREVAAKLGVTPAAVWLALRRARGIG